MNYILINAIIYLILWIVFYSKINRINLFVVAWSGFTLSSWMSYFSCENNLYYYNLNFVYDPSSIGTLICVLAINLILLFPLWKVDERDIDLLRINTEMPAYKTFVKISVPIFLVLSVMKIYETAAIESVSSYGDIYQQMHDDDTPTLLRDMLYSNSFLRMLSGAGANYCITMAPLIIIYIIKKISINRKLKIEYVLLTLITLIPVVLQGVVNASRGNLFFSMFQLLFYYIIACKYLKQKIRNIIYIGAVLMVIAVLGVSYAITESRIDTRRSSYTAFEDIATYFGQPMLNACYFQNRIKYHPMGKRMLDIRDSNNNDSFRDYWNNKTGSQLQLFKTCYGDLYLEFGLYGAFVFILIYTFLCNKLILRNFKNPIYIPFLWLYFNTLIYSIFNFKFFKLTGFWFFLLVIFCYYININSRRRVNVP